MRLVIWSALALTFATPAYGTTLAEDTVIANLAGRAAAASSALFVRAGGKVAIEKSVVSVCLLSDDLKLRCTNITAKQLIDPIGSIVAAKSVRSAAPKRVAVATAFPPQFMKSLKERK